MSVDLRYMPCSEFELSIHEYVDDELNSFDARSLLVHLELCDSCRGSVESVRSQIRIHRESLDFEKMAAEFDRGAFFQHLTGELLTSNVERLADLFYELGKAYFVSGNDSKLKLFLHRKAVSVERSRAESRRLLKESDALADSENAMEQRRVRASLRRAGQFLKGRRVGKAARGAGRTALDNARRFLEECLILTPDNIKARIILIQYFVRVDRPQEALEECRKALHGSDITNTHRAMILQAMGNTHSYLTEYDRAVACFQQIVDEKIVDDDARFFTVHLSLAMSQAKLDQFERSEEAFGHMLSLYPEKLEEARGVLEGANVFGRLLREQEDFRTGLVSRYPMLFAG